MIYDDIKEGDWGSTSLMLFPPFSNNIDFCRRIELNSTICGAINMLSMVNYEQDQDVPIKTI